MNKKKVISISLITLLMLVTLLTSGCLLDDTPEYKHYTGVLLSVIPNDSYNDHITFYFESKAIELNTGSYTSKNIFNECTLLKNKTVTLIHKTNPGSYYDEYVYCFES